MIHDRKSYFGAWYNNGRWDAIGKRRNWVKVWHSEVCVIWLYIVGLNVRSRCSLKLIEPNTPSSTPLWSYLHLTVQVYTQQDISGLTEKNWAVHFLMPALVRPVSPPTVTSPFIALVSRSQYIHTNLTKLPISHILLLRLGRQYFSLTKQYFNG